MSADFPTTITIDNTSLRLIIERKAVKNINARLRNNELLVSIPQRLARGEAMQIIERLAQRLLRRRHANEINQSEDALAIARRIALLFPQAPTIEKVQFTTTTSSCWGSYSPHTHSIRLNAALRYMPIWVLEAVMAHELAHIVHPDHSPAFWELLRRVYPRTDEAEAFLAGVTWLARSWDTLPPSERAQLTGEES